VVLTYLHEDAELEKSMNNVTGQKTLRDEMNGGIFLYVVVGQHTTSSRKQSSGSHEQDVAHGLGFASYQKMGKARGLGGQGHV
jgi:hypothetical protein